MEADKDGAKGILQSIGKVLQCISWARSPTKPRLYFKPRQFPLSMQMHYVKYLGFVDADLLKASPYKIWNGAHFQFHGWAVLDAGRLVTNRCLSIHLLKRKGV